MGGVKSHGKARLTFQNNIQHGLDTHSCSQQLITCHWHKLKRPSHMGKASLDVLLALLPQSFVNPVMQKSILLVSSLFLILNLLFASAQIFSALNCSRQAQFQGTGHHRAKTQRCWAQKSCLFKIINLRTIAISTELSQPMKRRGAKISGTKNCGD